MLYMCGASQLKGPAVASRVSEEAWRAASRTEDAEAMMIALSENRCCLLLPHKSETRAVCT